MEYRVANVTEDWLFQGIVQYALKVSTHVSFCTFRYYHQKDLHASFGEFMNSIMPFRVDTLDRFIFPRPYTKGQKFHLYKILPEIESCILKVTAIKDWSAPYYPEDITFYTSYKPWLRTISHEALMYAELTDTDAFLNLGAKLLPVFKKT